MNFCLDGCFAILRYLPPSPSSISGRFEGAEKRKMRGDAPEAPESQGMSWSGLIVCLILGAAGISVMILRLALTEDVDWEGGLSALVVGGLLIFVIVKLLAFLKKRSPSLMTPRDEIPARDKPIIPTHPQVRTVVWLPATRTSSRPAATWAAPKGRTYGRTASQREELPSLTLARRGRSTYGIMLSAGLPLPIGLKPTVYSQVGLVWARKASIKRRPLQARFHIKPTCLV